MGRTVIASHVLKEKEDVEVQDTVVRSGTVIDVDMSEMFEMRVLPRGQAPAVTVRMSSRAARNLMVSIVKHLWSSFWSRV